MRGEKVVAGFLEGNRPDHLICRDFPLSKALHRDNLSQILGNAGIKHAAKKDQTNRYAGTNQTASGPSGIFFHHATPSIREIRRKSLKKLFFPTIIRELPGIEKTGFFIKCYRKGIICN